MFIAQMDSETRTWYATGKREDIAKTAILRKWNEEQKRLFDTGWIDEPCMYSNTNDLDEEYGIHVFEVKEGECVVF